MIEKNNELKHVGVPGMRWGIRRSIANAHSNAAERHIGNAAKADKLIPKGGNLHRKAAESHKEKAAILDKKIVSDEIKIAKIKSIAKQKLSSLKKNAKTAAIVGGIIGGTLGTIAAARLMRSRSQQKAIRDAAILGNKWRTNRVAKNVIHLPAHMPRPVKKIDWTEMDKIASGLKRGQGGHYDVSTRTLTEMARMADILRQGGLP